MPTMRQHKVTQKARILGLGDPGTGKTGSLAEVCNRMDELSIKRVAILDWDDGLDVLDTYLKPEMADRVVYETCRDKMRATAFGPAPKEARALARGMGLMNNWKTKEYDLGQPNEWGLDTLLVIDTLTGMGDACINHAILNEKIEDNWRAVGAAMRVEDKFIQMLAALECHVIMFAHIRFMGGGGTAGTIDKFGKVAFKEQDSNVEGQAYPSALGRVLPPQVGRHFNIQLEWKLSGRHRKIRTVPKDRMAIKCPIKLADELPQETGLFEVMKAVISQGK